ncbi:uncharacterized protein LOC105778752 [Gossypium raimondii]|uniref:Uncharacterized protein n=1 Tax=Gossypium raimondii TaxID=29730 RepID=A0A0D2RZ01_GOSRA|nr:uncharacterized protein LOC105778752 [Gossypium raimondii]KJB75987.1 hypothetical protein B456_012G066800 [Gossypium raimondii]MBA0601083.1 hypothetical protein [Gossypium raimondii]
MEGVNKEHESFKEKEVNNMKSYTAKDDVVHQPSQKQGDEGSEDGDKSGTTLPVKPVEKGSPDQSEVRVPTQNKSNPSVETVEDMVFYPRPLPPSPNSKPSGKKVCFCGCSIS